MFCPNCGNDCKDAKFCVKCGTKIQSEEDAQSSNAVWSVGMPCPHCGGTKLDGNNCAFCGAQMIAAEPKMVRQQYPEPPVGKWYFCGRDGCLELTETYVKISMNFVSPEKRGRVIPYNEIFLVSFVPSKSIFATGFLCVRGWQDRHSPSPTTFLEAYDDISSVYFSKAYNSEFRVIYEFLKKCADINEKVRKQD